MNLPLQRQIQRGLFAAAGLLLTAALSAQTSTVTIVTSALPAGVTGTSYSAGLTVSGGTPNYTWSSTGTLPPGLLLNPGGAITGIPTSAGSYSFTLTVTDSRQASASKLLSITITGASLSVTSTSLPTAVVGQSYNATLTAAGGKPPYQWAAGPGGPGGLSLNATTGAITGTPSVAGAYTFPIQVTDSNQATATASITITVNPAPLVITTVAPLFNGTVGTAYAQNFSASGGKTPYTWAILSGAVAGLTLDPASGILQGTPQTTGTYPLMVQVTDAAGTKASQSFTLTVNSPALTITTGAPLPGAAVGVSYNQKFQVAATGGTPPYQWSLATGAVPGLTFDPVNVALSGTPTAAGTFSLTLQVTDAAGLTATKSFSLTVTPAALTISGSRQLPAGILSSAYSSPALTVSGGTPPYTWSAAGLPAGLTINPGSGSITGTPTAAGTFNPVVITVADAALNHYSDNFSLSVSLPPLPSVTISGLPSVAQPASQLPIQVAIASTYPSDISGQAFLSFSPDSGLGDGSILFIGSGTTANFTIPAGQTTASFTGNNGAPLSLQVQTGTVSGVITIALRVQAGGVDLTPVPAPSVSAQIARGAPVIVSATVSRTSTTLSIAVMGYSTAREVTQAVFTFKAAANQALQTTASSITIDPTSIFSGYFGSSSQGSVFLFTQPFTVQGDPNGVIPVSVTLTNRVGSTTATISQ